MAAARRDAAWRRQDNLKAALARLIHTSVRLERIRFVRRWLRGVQCPEPAAGRVPDRSPIWRPKNSSAHRSAGFYSLEDCNGRPFRWSEPVGVIEVALPPGDYEFVLEWLPVESVKNVRVYVDGRYVEAGHDGCRAAGGFTVDAVGPTQFCWTCEPSRAPGDVRLLGLPVVAVTWTSRARLGAPPPSLGGPLPYNPDATSVDCVGGLR